MIAIPIGLILIGLGWYLVVHKEQWQWRQLLVGALIGMFAVAPIAGPGLTGALDKATADAGAALSRMFNAAMNG